MAVTKYNGSTWYSIRSGIACPVCQSKKGRCSMLVNENQEEVMYRCKYAVSSRPSTDGWYLHLVSEMNGNAPILKESYKKSILEYNQKEISKEDIELWSKVYSEMRTLFYKFNSTYLYKEHKEDLIKRGLNEESIKRMGFFSVPRNEKIKYGTYTCTLKTAIVNELLKKFSADDLVKVPGFAQFTNKDKEFVTFKNTMKNQKGEFVDMDAYFIPYHDHNHMINAMQFRLTNGITDDKGKVMRYLWYSSKNVSCGSPVDYYIPTTIVNDDVILIIEGAIKGKISGEALGFKVLSEAGVTNYRRLVHDLQEIEKKDKKKYKILIALDMDKYSNNDVFQAELSTVSFLKSLGYSVSILEWDVNEGKGLDDKLLVSKKGFRFISV